MVFIPKVGKPISTSHPRRRLALWLNAGLFVLSLPSALAAAEAQGPLVSVIAAGNTVMKQSVAVVGTIVAKEATLINADVADVRIVSLHVEEGDLVTAGQLLAKLDSSKIEIELIQNDAQGNSASARLGQASSALDSAVLSKEEADLDLQRAQRLMPKGLISEEVFEQRQKVVERADVTVGSNRQAVRLAEADVATVVAARREIELRLRQTEIVAPVSGRIIKRSAKVGVVASSSSEPLFVIANEDQFELEAEIPQSKFGKILLGPKATISFGDDTAAIAGAVRFIAPSLAESTRLGRARISLQGLSAASPVGSFASARIELGERPGIFLPTSAISSTDGRPSVKVVKDNRIEEREITEGLRQDSFVQVRSGVGKGDLVVQKSGGLMEAGDEATPVLAQADDAVGHTASKETAP